MKYQDVAIARESVDLQKIRDRSFLSHYGYNEAYIDRLEKNSMGHEVVYYIFEYYGLYADKEGMSDNIKIVALPPGISIDDDFFQRSNEWNTGPGIHEGWFEFIGVHVLLDAARLAVKNRFGEVRKSDCDRVRDAGDHVVDIYWKVLGDEVSLMRLRRW